jgi:hypothetical protein
MTPKDGKAGTAVAPLDPKLPHAADKADPGEASKVKAAQRAAKVGKYGASEVPPYVPDDDPASPEQPKSWVEIVMVDEDNQPVAGEPFLIKLQNGQQIDGTTGSDGSVRVMLPEPAPCKLTFPNRDKDAWDQA